MPTFLANHSWCLVGVNVWKATMLWLNPGNNHTYNIPAPSIPDEPSHEYEMPLFLSVGQLPQTFTIQLGANTRTECNQAHGISMQAADVD